MPEAGRYGVLEVTSKSSVLLLTAGAIHMCTGRPDINSRIANTNVALTCLVFCGGNSWTIAIAPTTRNRPWTTRSASPTRLFLGTRTTFHATNNPDEVAQRRARALGKADGEWKRTPGDVNEDGHGATSIDVGSGGEGNAGKKTR